MYYNLMLTSIPTPEENTTFDHARVANQNDI
jgi:hypothetical protein